jgi:hypothetical protein
MWKEVAQDKYILFPLPRMVKISRKLRPRNLAVELLLCEQELISIVPQKLRYTLSREGLIEAKAFVCISVTA